MSPRERETRVRLDGMSAEQLYIVRRDAFGALVGKAGDLPLLDRSSDPKGAIREVAALARIAFWLQFDEAVLPERAGREVAQGLAAGVDALGEWEEVVERYEEAIAEHEAPHAFVAYFPEAGRSGAAEDAWPALAPKGRDADR
jgi:hypothetical protein